MLKWLSLALCMCAIVLATTAPAATQTTQQPKTYTPRGPIYQQNYKLFGSMVDALDPDQQPTTNEVISSSLDVNNPDALFAVAFRLLKTKIFNLDNQVQLKYYFQGTRNCFGGAPRIQLAIDLNGDNVVDGNAFGYVGPFPSFSGCTVGRWTFEDLTDNQPRWDITQFTSGPNAFCNQPGNVCPPVPPGFVLPWDAFESFVMAFPNHRVETGALVDDTFGGPGQTGTAFYDIVAIGNRTLDNWEDTTK